SLSGVAREVRTAAGTSQLAERAVPLPLPLPVRTGGSPSGARDAAQRAERLAAIAPALPAPRTGTGRGTVMGRGGAPRAARDGLLEERHPDAEAAGDGGTELSDRGRDAGADVAVDQQATELQLDAGDHLGAVRDALTGDLAAVPDQRGDARADVDVAVRVDTARR